MARGEILRVSAVQLNSQEHLTENLNRTGELVARAAKQGARVIVLPENFAFMGPEPEKAALAERLGEAGPIQACLSDLCRRHQVALIAGGMPERSADPARPYNSCVAFAPSGETVGVYRKIHLFDVSLSDGTELTESLATSAGTEPVSVELFGFRFGLSVCYDLRFPELYRRYSQERVDVLVVPAAFTQFTGKDHWHVLLRARAIENQSYLLAAAQSGRHPRGRLTYGHSLAVDPWGTVVGQASDGEGVVVVDLERSYLDKVRSSLPCLEHRRL